MALFGFNSSVAQSYTFDIPHLPDAEEAVFFLLEVAFFVKNEDSFISLSKNDTKVVYVLGVE